MSTKNGWEWVLGESGDAQRIENIPAPTKFDTEFKEAICPSNTEHFSLCPFVLRENNAGGEARAVVAHVADLLGIKLSEDIVDGDIWSSANMRRVIPALTKLKYGAKVVVNESKSPTINIHHSPPPAAAASVIPRYLQESMRRRSW